MSPDLPYFIPLAGTSALVILYFAIRSWTHGFPHPVVTAFSIVAGGAGAWFLFSKADAIFDTMNMESHPRMNFGYALLVGLFICLLLRKAGHASFQSTCEPGTLAGRLFAGPAGAILSLFPALLVIATIAGALRHQATFSELRYIDTCSALYARGSTTYPDTPYIVKLRNALEKIPRTAELFDRVDSYSPAPRRRLVGLSLISRNYDLFLAVGRDQGALEVYSSPRVTTLLAALPFTKLLDAREHRLLLKQELMLETATLPEVTAKLEAVDVLGALHQALGME